MKVVTVVGARPQFVKAAPVSKALRAAGHQEVLVHTGQHYDAAMSDVFFRDLGLPAPDHHLGVGSGPHGEQTGRMLAGVEQVLLRERPDAVLVHGDTNSTLAGALAAAKLHVPVAHVEAGLRSYNRAMPEELNRVLTDHLATWLFCPTERAAATLAGEGVTRGVHVVGDVMHEVFLERLPAARARLGDLDALGLKPGGYALATLHRAETTDDPARLREALAALDGVARTVAPVLLPLHPRTERAVREAGLGFGAVRTTPPLAYDAMLTALAHARLVLTDSGGLQKEAAWAGVPCITMRTETEWVELVEAGWNTVAGTDPRAVLAAAQRARPGKALALHGGPASQRIVAALAAGVPKA